MWNWQVADPLRRDRVLLRELLERGVHVVREAPEEREIRHRSDQATGHDDFQSPDPVGEPAENDEERRSDQK